MKIIGHRGARGLAPENTVASLLKALEHHVDEIELDLRLTKDDILVLQHDPTLTDRSGNRLKVATHTLHELREHKADLATFGEATGAIKHRIPLLIEVKPGVDPTAVIAAVKALLQQGWKSTDLLLESRNFAILWAFHEALPGIELGVIDRWSGVRASWRARRLGARRLVMNERWLWAGFISSMSHHGWQLYAYTLNDPVKARRWTKYGLAGVITDYPDRYE